jgi:hypothetical protein
MVDKKNNEFFSFLFLSIFFKDARLCFLIIFLGTTVGMEFRGASYNLGSLFFACALYFRMVNILFLK